VLVVRVKVRVRVRVRVRVTWKWLMCWWYGWSLRALSGSSAET